MHQMPHLEREGVKKREEHFSVGGKLKSSTFLQPARAAAIFLLRNLFSKACYTIQKGKEEHELSWYFLLLAVNKDNMLMK